MNSAQNTDLVDVESLQTPSAANRDAEDVFDAVLNLEEQYYQEGYDLGAKDGEKAGRIEGRLFGMQKGFEKMLEMGTLYGRARVWKFRLSNAEGTPRYNEAALEDVSRTRNDAVAKLGKECDPSKYQDYQLRPSLKGDEPLDKPLVQARLELAARLSTVPNNSRLEKHIDDLLVLTDPSTLSTENDDDSIEDFDDRLKRATAKSRIIESILKEVKLDTVFRSSSDFHHAQDKPDRESLAEEQRTVERNVEDFGRSLPR